MNVVATDETIERGLEIYREVKAGAPPGKDWLDIATEVAHRLRNPIGMSRWADFVAAVKREEGLT